MSTKRLPKHIKMSESIAMWIQTGKYLPGQQIPTEIELSTRYHVSRQTVRQAISNLVSEGLLIREQGRGTFVAHRSTDFKKGSSKKIVGVITTYISDYIFPSIIRGIESVLSDAGYSVLLLSTGNDLLKERDALRRILETEVDGLIVEPTKSAFSNPNLDLYFKVLERKIPIVMLHASYVELSAPTIKIDDSAAAVVATQHLLAQGHTNLGGIFKTDDLQGKLRLQGFIRAHMEQGLAPATDFLSFFETQTAHIVITEFVKKISLTPQPMRPTGVLCYNDEIANQLIKSLNEAGLEVPKDISIVGFDDSYLAEFGEVPLTTMTHPKTEMGIKAGQLIIQHIKRPRESDDLFHDFVLESNLIVRKSVANSIPLRDSARD